MKGRRPSFSRGKNALRNAAAGLVSAAAVNLLPFVTRSVFVSVLDESYLGINGLFANVLGVLSFTELGIGTAVSYSLYSPIADRDYARIAAVMGFYRKMCRLVALAVLLGGLCLFPFLGFLIRDGGQIEDLGLYYILFLLNSSLSYLLIYRHVILQSDQNSHIQSLAGAAFTVLRTVLGCCALLVFRSFIFYLITDFIAAAARHIYVNRRIDRLYPCLALRPEPPLGAGELSVIKRNVKALIFHRMGGIGVYQSGNLLLSYFSGIASVGLLSNYSMIFNSVAQLAGVIFSGATAGFGNAVITEDKGRRHELFKVYSFTGFWIYAWTSVCLLSLTQPFISLWVGERLALPFHILPLMAANHYMTGVRSILENIKAAAGLYDNDKYVSVIQGALNVALSAAFIYLFGTAGLFMGLIASGLLPLIAKPVIIYRHVFGCGASVYFRRQALYAVITGLLCAGVYALNAFLLPGAGPGALLLRGAVCATVPNAALLALFGRSAEFVSLKKIIAAALKR